MVFFQALREYTRSSPWPENGPIFIQFKHGLGVKLEVPNFGVEADDDQSPETQGPLTRVVLAHAAFKASMQPETVATEKFFKTCTSEVNVISLFFPDIKADAIRIVFTAWLSFACVMDDILEMLEASERELALLDSIDVLSNAAHSETTNTKARTSSAQDHRVPTFARALLEHVTRYLPTKSSQAFFTAVCEVLRAHVAEIHFLQSENRDSLAEYLSIRGRTIALSPFFEVIKTEYLEEADWAFNDAWLKLQADVSRVAGLQNDMIGLVRDIEDGEQLNAVMVLMKGFKGHQNGEVNHSILSRCLAMVNAEHNRSADRCIQHMSHLHRVAETSPGSAVARVERVARHIIMMCETHLRWCSSSKRYRLEVGVNGHIATPPESVCSTLPSPVLTHGAFSELPPKTEETMQPSSTSVVHSKGIVHGLPSFPKSVETTGLTAIVTGATGLSGYHMVKVLAAAPHRWKKIYCLSSRPPPDNFFEDLGEGARRVEHLAVDFLSEPSEIAKHLQGKIDHVDHIFYFSYVQPAPKGDVMDLWANADELARVNVELFENFVGALRQTTLTPRRFMLQTGSKHYSFYLGPASIPAFETDPRVTLDRNFYYEQEDTLVGYCSAVGATWSVARPSYIVGAVRDGTLNHLIGFGIYAAVQAELGQPICFPGDYSAWDREQVQSSGLLNAYFEEWLVLAGDKTANEAFNIHDGQSFTWGRLWPYLARWYGVQWEPPSTEEGKYRVMQLPYPTTPRGYGPQLTMRSTFSLLEWSFQPHVEAAWRRLADRHQLVLDPFDDRYRARIFSFSDSAVIGDAPMTTSVRKARDCGFFGTVDSYESIFDSLRALARLRLVPAPTTEKFEA
ncbi:uncharacterized protein C8A04DRAFT_9097 [Dichotomopilus funicola]|uniref:PRISE-like Rossmann-fold domain-containing protein n=1 Tax=Dichotomopilus funicola TaxID=1934379 RepID=A0AAN6ZRG0_9PEZI|nr:hypothetical protein C8A04DRAFT_9097 [Dichotomopilus funicola]